jgi:hypothetical protein
MPLVGSVEPSDQWAGIYEIRDFLGLRGWRDQPGRKTFLGKVPLALRNRRHRTPSHGPRLAARWPKRAHSPPFRLATLLRFQSFGNFHREGLHGKEQGITQTPGAQGGILISIVEIRLNVDHMIVWLWIASNPQRMHSHRFRRFAITPCLIYPDPPPSRTRTDRKS